MIFSLKTIEILKMKTFIKSSFLTGEIISVPNLSPSSASLGVKSTQELSGDASTLDDVLIFSENMFLISQLKSPPVPIVVRIFLDLFSSVFF